MEAKKTRRADLQNRRVLFTEIGLVVALIAVVGAFSWGQAEKTVERDLDYVAPVEAEVIDVTRQDEKPPEVKVQPIQAVSDFINVLQDDQKIDTEYNFDDFDENISITVPVVEAEAEEDIPTFTPDEYPTFQGGDIYTFRNWVRERLDYPAVALENSISGTVSVTFIIERDGSLTNIEVLVAPDRSLSEEAVRVLKMSPKWTPGRTRGRTVRVKYSIPVNFVLEQQ